MNAPACRYCRSTVPIPNHAGGLWCSGCLMDWAPRAASAVIVAFDVVPLRRGFGIAADLLSGHEVQLAWR